LLNRTTPKQLATINKTALLAAVHEYRRQGWTQQKIALHLGYSRSYIRKLLRMEVNLDLCTRDHNGGPTDGSTNPQHSGNTVPELQRILEVIQEDCREAAKKENEEIRLQILEDLQLERKMFLNALTLLGATPEAILEAPQSRQIQHFITGLQQLSMVLHRNTEALLKMYRLGTEKYDDSDIFNIDYLEIARSAGLRDLEAKGSS